MSAATVPTTHLSTGAVMRRSNSPGKFCTMGCSSLVYQALEVAKRELRFLLVSKLKVTFVWALC